MVWEQYIFGIDEIYEFFKINIINFLEKNRSKTIFNILSSHIILYLIKDDVDEIERDENDSGK